MFQLRANISTLSAYALTMALLTFFTFGSLSTHLFDTDDHEYLEHASQVVKGDASLFPSGGRLPVRPVIDLLAWGSYLLWGDNPAPYHILLVVVLLHLLASLLLAYTLRQLGIGLELSLLAALLFLMNVAHFRVVHWVTCRSYVLALTFGLGMLICYSRFLASRRVGWMAGAVGLQAVAISVQPAMVSASLFCAYLAWRRTDSLKQAAATALPLVGPALCCAVLAYVVSPWAPQVQRLLTPPHPVHILMNLLWYISRLFTNAHWLFAGLSDEPRLWELGVGLLACTGIFILYRRRLFPAADWTVWSLITVLPFAYASKFLLAGPSRHLYFPSVGTSILLAYLIRLLAGRIGARLGRRWGQVAFILLLLGVLGSSFTALKRTEAISFYTSGRSYIARGMNDPGIQQLERAFDRDADLVPFGAYTRLATTSFGGGKSPRNLLEKALAKHPDSPELNMLLGISTFLQDDPDFRKRGEKRIRKAFDRAEDKEQLRLNTAVAYFNVGVYYYYRPDGREQAETLFRSAILLRPDYPLAHLGLANVLCLQDRTEEAVQAYRTAIELQPDYASAYQNLGSLLAKQGNNLEAAAALEKAVALDPNRAHAWYLVAQVRRISGRLDTACQAGLNALRQAPSRVEYWDEYFQIGNLYHVQGQMDRALSIYRDIVQALPDLSNVHYNLGRLYYNQGRYAEAVSSLERTVELSPDDSKAYLVLAQAYKKTGRMKEALRSYRHTLSLDPDSTEAGNGVLALLQRKSPQ